MKQPQLTENAKRQRINVINSIINRSRHNEIKTTAAYLQQLMAEKAMETPKPQMPLTPQQLAYIEGRKSGIIKRNYQNENRKKPT